MAEGGLMAEKKHIDWGIVSITILCSIITYVCYFISHSRPEWSISYVCEYLVYLYAAVSVICLIATAISLVLGISITNNDIYTNYSIGSEKDIPKEVLYRNHPPIVNHDDPEGGFYSPIDLHRLSSEEMNFYRQNGRWW